ncbi:MAG: ABC transporter ATP-binding protein [Kiritimatiellae bacterium]|nr:ABC transporter ATP-binding protein [Kiritimatiellia bacterium]
MNSHPVTNMPASAISESPTPAIVATNLSKTFRDFWRRPRVKAVCALTLSVPSGAIYGLLGPNGSGKSTTLKMILGLLFPTSGELSVLGLPPTSPAARRRIGYLPEETRLYPTLTPLEILSFHARLLSLPRPLAKSRADELLASLDLQAAARRPVGAFSKGMARRVGLAVALLGDPDLLILDEPPSGLDPIATRQVKDLMLDLAARGKTILTTSHLLADVQDTCRRVAILHHGHLLAEGPLDDLLQRATETTLSFPTPASPDASQAALQAVATALGLPPASLHLSHPRKSLEEYFLDILAHDPQPPPP